MRRSIYTISFLFLLCCFSLSCQSIKSTQVNLSDHYLLQGQFEQIKIDKLGFLYLLNDNNELLKFDEDLNLLFKYSINSLGDVATIDVSNPQKIILYFSDYQFILFLDNTLSEIKRLNLESFGYWDIQSAALSNDNLIWIYDPVNFRLIKISDNGQLKLQSNELFYDDASFSTNQIFSHENFVYLYSNQKLVLFDSFGLKLKTLITPNEQIQFLGDQFLVLDDNKILLKNFKVEFLEENNIPVIDFGNNNILGFYYYKNNVFTIDKNGLQKIKITEF